MRLVSIVCICVACGGGTEAGKPAVTVTDVDAGGSEPVHAARPHVGFPRDAALVLTGDVSLILKLDVVSKEIAHTLEIKGDLVSAVGLDTSRPATLVMAAPDAKTNAVIDELKPIAASPSPQLSTHDLCVRLHDMQRPSFIRVLLPATNVQALEDSVMKLLEKEDGWEHGKDGLKKGSMNITVSDDDRWVAFDVGYGGFHPMQNADQPPPALEGKQARFVSRNAALARVSFIEGLTRTCGALSGGSIEPDQKDRILKMGLHEASQVFALTTFDELDADLTLSPFALTFRATPGSSFTMPNAAALAPTVSMAMSGATLSFERATALSKSWPLPGGDSKKLLEMARDAGELGLLIALPHIAGGVPFQTLDDPRNLLADDAVAAHFERIESIAMLAQGEQWLTVGVMPAGTTRAVAECSLDTTCNAKTRLTLGKVQKRATTVGDRYAKLVEVKVAAEKNPRYVVLTARKEAALASTPAPHTASALHFDIAAKELASQIPFPLPFAVPDHVMGDLSVDGGQLVFKLQ